MSSGGASSGGGGGGGFLTKLKALDAYPKINEDFFTKTMSGGIITIVASVVMVLLFLSELRELRGHDHEGPGEQPSGSTPEATGHICCTGLYLTTNSVHELTVDTSRGEKISINVSGSAW